MTHGRYCIRTDGDWKCGGDCTHDADERAAREVEKKIAAAREEAARGGADDNEATLTKIAELLGIMNETDGHPPWRGSNADIVTAVEQQVDAATAAIEKSLTAERSLAEATAKVTELKCDAWDLARSLKVETRAREAHAAHADQLEARIKELEQRTLPTASIAITDELLVEAARAIADLHDGADKASTKSMATFVLHADAVLRLAAEKWSAG